MSLFAPYSKIPAKPEEQILILERRGMKFHDRAFALERLRVINYYRLRIYWIIFEDKTKTGSEDHYFKDGTFFEDVYELYKFDRKLRHVYLDAIERVEIAVRTRWSNLMALDGGPFAHRNQGLFLNWGLHAELLRALRESYGKSDEEYAQHYKRKYGLDTPPVWASSELFTITKLSKWFENTRKGTIKEQVGQDLGLTGAFLVSYLHQLSMLRNTAAHHSRLWNRQFPVALAMPPKTGLPCGLKRDQFAMGDRRRLYHITLVTHAVLKRISPQNSWTERLRQLISKYPKVPVDRMGFPRNWEQELT